MKRDIRQLEPSKKITTVGVAQDEENEDDPYKPEGFVELHIDRFREFSRGTFDSQQRLSTATYIRGLPWKILAIPKEFKESERAPMADRRDRQPTAKYLGFFLQCNVDTTDPTWNCQAIATLRIVSQKEGVEDNVRKIVHYFSIKENDWGYSQFVSCDVLLDPSNGFINNDTVILQAEVIAEVAHFFHSVDKGQIFSSSSPYPSDCVIVLKNKKEVHVNKNLLSIHSKYFKEQFAKNDESKQVLDDVNYDDFVELLCVIYPIAHPISANNVEEITMLAYKLVMPEMLNRCEASLMKNKEKAFRKAKLLLMAQEYGLEHLQAHCISEHKSIDDVKTIRNEPEYTSLDSRTKRMLLDKILGTNSTSALPLSSVPESSNAASKPTVVTRTAAILEDLASSIDCPPDVVLIVGDKRIQAHKQYLSIYSKYFNAMFQGGFKEGRENEIKLEEIGYDEIVELLSVVYPSEFSITDTNVGSVLKLADRFLMPAILTQCKKVLKTRKAIKGARRLWYAQRYNFEDLRDEFARGCKNIADVMKMKVEPEFELLDDDTRALILDNITAE